MKRFLIVIERTESGYSAYSPDLPRCISRGRTESEMQRNMREAIEFHLAGLREEGMWLPEPHSSSASVDVPA